MRRTITFTAALLAVGLGLAGCAAPMSYESAPDYAPAPAGGVVYEESLVRDSELQSAADRQVITTGYMSVVVAAPLDAATETTRIVEAAGGRVDGRTEYAPTDGRRASASLTLRIPATNLTAVLEQLKALGDAQQVTLQASDVTMQTQDLDARIGALEAAVERLLALLANADSTEALIQLETAITDRQAELDSLKSQRRYLADQVSMSTISLELISTQDAPVEDPDTFFSGLEAGWNALVAFFAGLLVVAGVLLPWLVLAAIVAFVIIVIVRAARRRKQATPPVE